MKDREILAAALRWSRAYEERRAIGAEKRRLEETVKALSTKDHFNPYSPFYEEACRVRSAAGDAAQRLTLARRKEQAAMRDLAKICAKVREGQKFVADATYTIDNSAVKTLTIQR